MTGKQNHHDDELISIYFTFCLSFSPDQLFEMDRFLKFTLVYILTTIVADGFGLILGSVFTPVVR